MELVCIVESVDDNGTLVWPTYRLDAIARVAERQAQPLDAEAAGYVVRGSWRSCAWTLVGARAISLTSSGAAKPDGRRAPTAIPLRLSAAGRELHVVLDPPGPGRHPLAWALPGSWDGRLEASGWTIEGASDFPSLALVLLTFAPTRQCGCGCSKGH